MSDRLIIDHYVIDTLMRDLVAHDHRPSAFLVYLALLDLADAGRPTPSHAQLAHLCGLSKRAVQNALRHLAKRQLISVERRGRTEPAIVRPLAPWRARKVQAEST